MSSARLFFALWPGSAERAAVQVSCQAVMAACDGRPVPPRNYHLTLAFLGQVDSADVAGIRAAAGQVSVPAMTLVLDQVGYFSGPRALWVGPSEVPPALTGLVDELWQTLAPLGLRSPAQAFHPHLTLCRKMHQPPAKISVPPVRWRVRGFALVRSVTASSGAEYSVDQCFPSGSSIEP